MSIDLGLDVAELPKELRALLLILNSGRDGHKLPERTEWFAELDWSRFLQLVRHHRVFPSLYKRVKELGAPIIPTPIVTSLYSDYRKNTFQMLHLSGMMEQICTLFAQYQIRALLLKGPVLATVLYGDLSLRTSGDLDILISIKDLEKADILLKKYGFVKEEYFSTVLNEWKWRHHHVNYFHMKNGIKLELHWRLNPGPSIEPSFHELWKRRWECTFTSHPVFIPGREDLFLFLVSHGARHGWSRLRWLADIDQMARQPVDWSRLTAILKKYNCSHTAGQAIILASNLFHTPVIDEMKTLTGGSRPKRLAHEAFFYIRQMVNLHTDPLSDEVARYHKRHLFSLMSTRQKLLFLISFLYPYPQDTETLPLPTYLHFLYFPLRPLLWAWRKARKQTVPQGDME